MSKRQHGVRKKIPCPFCNIKIVDYNLKEHISRMHQQKSTDPSPTSANVLPGPSKLQQFGFSVAKVDITKTGDQPRALADETKAATKPLSFDKILDPHITKKIKTDEKESKIPTLSTAFLRGMTREKLGKFKYTGSSETKDIKIDKDVKAGTPTLQTSSSSSSQSHSVPIVSEETLLSVFVELRTAKSPQEIRNTLAPLETEIMQIRENLYQAEPQLFSPITMTPTQPFSAFLRTDIESHFQAVKTPSDGNCFYDSVSKTLFGNSSYTHQIRLAILHEFVREEMKIRQVTSAMGTAYEGILNPLKTLPQRSNEGWADESVMFFASEVLGRPIYSHEPSIVLGSKGNTQLFNSNPANLEKEPIVLMYKASHFMPLMPKEHHAPRLFPAIEPYGQIQHKYIRPSGPLLISEEFLKGRAEHDQDLLEIIEQTRTVPPEPVPMESRTFSVQSPRALIHEKVVIEGEDVEMMSEKLSGRESSDDTYSSNNTRKEVSKLKDKIDELVATFQATLQLQATVSTLRVPEALIPPAEHFHKKFESIKTVEDLLKADDCLETRLDLEMAEHEEIFNRIICKPCFDPLSREKVGHFIYSSNLGVDFHDQNQPEEFRKLKHRIKNHMEGKTHQQKALELQSKNQIEKTFITLNYEVGVKLGKLAYTAIKMDGNMSRYEDYIAIEASNNGKVGDINHSRKFCREYAHSVFKCLQVKMIQTLQQSVPGTGRPTPFAVIADGYTPRRLPGQIVGLVAYTNGGIRALFIDFAKHFDQTAAGTAESLMSSLRSVFEQAQIKERLVGGCFDGAYIENKKVYRPLMGDDNLQVAEEAKPWYSWVWDKPHIIERAFESANEIPKMKEIDDTIMTIQKKFSHGLSFAEMHTKSGGDMRVPQAFSETRFATYHARVVTNFIHNFPSNYDYLKSKNDPSLKKMDTVSFVINVSGKLDLVTEIGKLSQQLQKVDLVPWRVDEYVENQFENLRNMVGSLDGELHPDFVMLKKAIREWEGSSTFRGKPIVLNRQQEHATRQSQRDPLDFPTIREKFKHVAVQFVNTFERGFRSRSDPSINGAHQYASTAFKLENIILNHLNKAVPGEFLEYFKLSKAAGYLTTEITEEDISQEYLEFSSLCNNLTTNDTEYHPNDLGTRPWDVEKRVFNRILNSKNTLKIQNVADLLVSAMVRTNCEAATESMGSVVKSVQKDRDASFSNVMEETFISWNGPMPYRADKLIIDAMDNHFGSRDDWRFHRRTQDRSLLKFFTTSEVVDRKNKEAMMTEKLPYN